ncbi:MAG: pseudaminic acid biosynthesis-associated methylase [Candidatus Omnitrophota bacterium]
MGFTDQMLKWSGKFGDEYTTRNTLSVEELDGLYVKEFGVGARELFGSFIGGLDREARILEVGSNSGNMLLMLQAMGFKNIYGVEINSKAVELCKSRTKGINIIQGSAFDVPFRDGYFDLVFTAGVLIHIKPDDINKVLSEIYRCSRRFILGIEFFAESYREIEYRGEQDLLWKTDFEKLYLETFSGLKKVSDKKIKYADSGKENMIFLMEKGKK